MEPATPPRQQRTEEPDWAQEIPLPARLGLLGAWLTLVVCLAMTVLAWHFARRDIEDNTRRYFEVHVDEITTSVLNRMQAQEQVLRGARGLFQASTSVTRREWHDYVEALRLGKTYPGIQGVGFARYITLDELREHIRSVQAEGFPDYLVRPPGDRAEYTSIVYLEPFDWRNQRAFGFDMFTEPTRREAMEAARDTGEPATSGKVTLVQETAEDIQAGFLMYLPVYRRGAPVETVAQRRDALLGYVYSPFRAKDLMSGILGPTLPNLRLEIYDGSVIDADRLIYDSHPPATRQGVPTDDKPAFIGRREIVIQGRPWTLRVSSRQGFDAGISDQREGIILLAGSSISLLMAMVVWSLATLGRRSVLLAQRMTAALRESREQFRAVAETATDPIVSTDEAGRITYFNQAAENIFGYGHAEALGQSLVIIIPERLQAAHASGMRRFLATGEPRIIGKTVEMVARRKSGEEFPIEISLSHWSSSEGLFFTAIMRDISERVESGNRISQLNRELQHQVEQLAEVNQELESFSYSVSHDLRAPLRAIGGFARILEESHGPGLDPEARRLVGIILESSRKMSQLIDDLLAFARLGQTPVSRASVDMVRLVQEAVEEIRQAGDCSEVSFSVGELPQARGDRALLRQVWTNLIANAVKFSRPRTRPEVETGCRMVDGEWQYYVRDNGVGFDMDHAGQLFGVFQRLHRAEHFPGTGVGLAIVHRIIAKHGGHIWAESRVDQGATFYFTLPAGPAD